MNTRAMESARLRAIGARKSVRRWALSPCTGAARAADADPAVGGAHDAGESVGRGRGGGRRQLGLREGKRMPAACAARGFMRHRQFRSARAAGPTTATTCCAGASPGPTSGSRGAGSPSKSASTGPLPDRLPLQRAPLRNRSDTYQTPYSGAGGDVFTLAPSWIVPRRAARERGDSERARPLARRHRVQRARRRRVDRADAGAERRGRGAAGGRLAIVPTTSISVDQA